MPCGHKIKKAIARSYDNSEIAQVVRGITGLFQTAKSPKSPVKVQASDYAKQDAAIEDSYDLGKLLGMGAGILQFEEICLFSRQHNPNHHEQFLQALNKIEQEIQQAIEKLGLDDYTEQQIFRLCLFHATNRTQEAEVLQLSPLMATKRQLRKQKPLLNTKAMTNAIQHMSDMDSNSFLNYAEFFIPAEDLMALKRRCHLEGLSRSPTPAQSPEPPPAQHQG